MDLPNFDLELFYNCCISGDLETIKKIQVEGEEYINSGFRIASWDGHLSVVRYLLEHLGANVNTGDDYAVIYASCNGHFELVKYLCEAGANSRADNDIAIMFASSSGYLEIVIYLFSLIKEIDRYIQNSYSVLAASRNGHLHIVKYLIQMGLNITDESIRAASDNNHLEVAKFLLGKKRGDNLSIVSEKCRNYILFCDKIQNKIRERAQKKIYFWWIPICYDTTHPSGCGQRMMQKNWEKTLELFKE